MRGLLLVLWAVEQQIVMRLAVERGVQIDKVHRAIGDVVAPQDVEVVAKKELVGHSFPRANRRIGISFMVLSRFPDPGYCGGEQG